jgi:predicted permease
MSTVIASLLPVIGLILLGIVLRRTLLPRDEHWSGLERLAYYVLFPALIAETLARADLAAVPVLGVGGALFLAVCVMSAGLVLAFGPLTRALAIDGPGFTSLFQGATRWNTFIALALAGALFGQKGVTLAAVAMVAMIPVLNLFAVLVHARYAKGGSPRPGEIGRALATNPLILACVIGMAVNLSGLPVPKTLLDIGRMLGQASLPLALILVGAGLNLAGALVPKASVFASTALKLAVMPLVAVGLALLFGVQGAGLAIVAICSGVPTASNAYVLARQLGGDAPLMAEIITVQTIASALTLPVVVLLAGLAR